MLSSFHYYLQISLYLYFHAQHYLSLLLLCLSMPHFFVCFGQVELEAELVVVHCFSQQQSENRQVQHVTQ